MKRMLGILLAAALFAAPALAQSTTVEGDWVLKAPPTKTWRSRAWS